MKKYLLYSLPLLYFIFACETAQKEEIKPSAILFEKINYYNYPLTPQKLPFKYRLTYYFENGIPHRWIELDSAGKFTTDYIYEYDSAWTHIGARYREESTPNFSIEQVRYENDSTRVTEWLDSTGTVYYKMIDNLNQDKKTYRAAFIGEELHGYDSTFYTKEGFEKRIFFTNTKGKVFNDRLFNYETLNGKGDWVKRKKVMQDSIQEEHIREVYYNNDFVSKNGKFYEGVITTGEFSENVISFSKDESVMLLTRTTNWTNQTAFIAHKVNGVYTETKQIAELDTIYNGAISPNGNNIIYTIRNDTDEEIWLVIREDEKWTNKINITQESTIKGGYFYWFNDSELYFYQDKNNGDIALGELKENKLRVTDSLAILNTKEATEFSPYVDKEKRFIIFTRYEEGNPTNQGFFVSYNLGEFDNPNWSTTEKLSMLPYGWNAYIINNGTQFIYTDGEDIFSLPIKKLNLKLK